MSRHECAVPGCKKSIVAGVLMCKLHWFKVSAKTRAWVNHTWNTLRLTERTNPVYLQNLKNYRSAVASAVSEVQTMEELSPEVNR